MTANAQPQAPFEPAGSNLIPPALAANTDPLPLARPRSILSKIAFGVAYLFFLLPLTLLVTVAGVPLAFLMSIALAVRAGYGFFVEMMVAIVEQRRPCWAGSGVVYALTICPRTLAIVGPYFLPKTWLRSFDGDLDTVEQRPQLFYGWKEFWTTLMVTVVFWLASIPLVSFGVSLLAQAWSAGSGGQ